MNKIIPGLFIMIGILMIVDGSVSFESLFFYQNTYYINENYTADCVDADINSFTIMATSIIMLFDGVFACLCGLIIIIEKINERANGHLIIFSFAVPIGMIIYIPIMYLIVHDCISFINYVELFLTFPIIVYFMLILVKLITVVFYVYKNKNNIEIISVENINDGNNGELLNT